MLKKNPFLWVSVIAVLAILNLWKWIPSKNRVFHDRGRDSAGLELDFPAETQAVEKNIPRDLFSLAPSSAGVGRRVRLFRRQRAVAIQPSPVPVASPLATAPDGSVLEAAGGYRLTGIASRNGKSEALVGKGDQLFQVGVGEDIEGRYKVQAITESEVYLTENQTGNTLKLRIWDQTGSGH